MFQTTKVVSGGILWANLHLLFWLSLFPFSTAWMGENHVAPAPTAGYGIVLLMAASCALEWTRLYRYDELLPGGQAGGVLGAVLGPLSMKWLGFAGSGVARPLAAYQVVVFETSG